MANIVQKDRKAYRVWDKTNSEWNELNLKTNAKSVDASDGKTLETKIGVINGITSDPNAEADDIAASAALVNSINSSLGGFKFYTDEQGKAYYKPMGADSGIPFSLGVLKQYEVTMVASNTQKTITILEGGEYTLLISYGGNRGGGFLSVSSETIEYTVEEEYHSTTVVGDAGYSYLLLKIKASSGDIMNVKCGASGTPNASGYTYVLVS